MLLIDTRVFSLVPFCSVCIYTIIIINVIMFSSKSRRCACVQRERKTVAAVSEDLHSSEMAFYVNCLFVERYIRRSKYK